MSIHSFFPDLQIIPVTSIKLQEYVQESRVEKLALAMKKEAVLRHPPIVTQSVNGTFLHLDGANRISAVSLLGYANCLVQEVDYSDPKQVHLTSWSHLTTMDKSKLFAAVDAIPGVQRKEHKTFDHRLLLKPRVLAVAVFSDSSVWEITCRTNFADFVRQMGALVDVYEAAAVERVYSEFPWTRRSIGVRFQRFPEHNVFLAFPTFSPQQIMTLADAGVLLPAGITRHVVYRRKLNVNMPLSYLGVPSLADANKKLQKFLQKRTVRFYEEPVIYFE